MKIAKANAAIKALTFLDVDGLTLRNLVVVRLLSNCCLIVIQLLSNCCLIVVQLLSINLVIYQVCTKWRTTSAQTYTPRNNNFFNR